MELFLLARSNLRGAFYADWFFVGFVRSVRESVLEIPPKAIDTQPRCLPSTQAHRAIHDRIYVVFTPLANRCVESHPMSN